MRNFLHIPALRATLNGRRLGVLLAISAVTAGLLVWLEHCTQVQSVDRGQAIYAARCVACHSLDSNLTGPLHRGVLNRPVGSVPDFDYSPALRHSHLVWTRANLLAWLRDPEALIPGQGMDFHLEQARDREDVVAYLATLKAPGK